MERHQWRERSDDGLRFFRAEHHAGRWTIFSQLKGEQEWLRHEPIETGLWRTLRDLLWRKYQRRRCPWEMVEAIDRILEGEEPADQ